MRVSVIVPVYNEAENVLPLVEELAALRGALPELEVIMVDDGSQDGTWAQVEAAVARWPEWARGLRHARNRGQSAAMLTGLAQATGELLVTLDGDLQNNPSDIPVLVSLIGPDCDVVCGYRANRRDSWSRRLASRLANAVRNRVTRDGVRDTGCSLKAFRAACRADLPPLDGVHRFMPAYFALNGRRIREIAVDHRARRRGLSKYTNWKRLPKTVFDLVGFIWYRQRYLLKAAPPMKNTAHRG